MASQKLIYLQQDFAEFQAFNPVRFTAQFMIDFEKAILSARDFVDDETIVDGGTSLTQTVQDKLKEAQRLYKIIKYFVEDAFKNDTGIQNKFGLDNYKDVRANAAQMVIFLSNMYNQCVQYQAQLTAMGLDVNKITDLQKVRDELYIAVNQQGSFLGDRLSITQERKRLYEEMDNFTQEVCRAGKLIYEDENEAKYQNYLIYQSSNNNTASETKNIGANSTEVAVNSGLDATKGVRFYNKGNTILEIYIVGSLQDIPTQTRSVQSQETVIIPALSISNGQYNVLIVRNNSSVSGKYEVEVLEQS